MISRRKQRIYCWKRSDFAAGAPDANAAILAADEASSAALLAMGIAMEAQTAKELANNEWDERSRMTSVECAAKVAAKVVERDRKCAEKEAEEEAQRVAKIAAKAAERDTKWTAEVDALIESMINGNVSFLKIASKLGNDLSTSDIKNWWYDHMKESSGITKPPVQTGFPSRITWTEDDDATIVRMRAEDISYAKIASELGNGLKKNDIKNRWNCHLKDKLQ